MQELVKRAAVCDSDAWETIFRRSHGRLLAFARRRTSSMDTAEDAVSETMVRALERIDRYTWDGAGFDAWLFGILRNVVLEGYRKERRTRRDRLFAFDYFVRSDDPPRARSCSGASRTCSLGLCQVESRRAGSARTTSRCRIVVGRRSARPRQETWSGPDGPSPRAGPSQGDDGGGGP